MPKLIKVIPKLLELLQQQVVKKDKRDTSPLGILTDLDLHSKPVCARTPSFSTRKVDLSRLSAFLSLSFHFAVRPLAWIGHSSTPFFLFCYFTSPYFSTTSENGWSIIECENSCSFSESRDAQRGEWYNQTCFSAAVALIPLLPLFNGPRFQ